MMSSSRRNLIDHHASQRTSLCKLQLPEGLLDGAHAMKRSDELMALFDESTKAAAMYVQCN